MFTCLCCQQCNIGGTSLQLSIRSPERVGISYRTNAPLNKIENSTIRDRSRTRNHPLRM